MGVSLHNADVKRRIITEIKPSVVVFYRAPRKPEMPDTLCLKLALFMTFKDLYDVLVFILKLVANKFL